jgi:hypothetical protein
MSIERFEGDGKPTHGFYVRVRVGGTVRRKFFGDGGAEGARTAAEAHEAAVIAERGPLYDLSPRRHNKSGMTGVSRRKDFKTGLPQWHASWTDGDGRNRAAGFSVRKYGEEEAFRRAVEARRAGVEARGAVPRSGTVGPMATDTRECEGVAE